MPPPPEKDNSVEVEEPETRPDEVADDDATQKQASKRRTKTGCLTCRKRRIKCGEEKPICRNCIKSKRECLGYVQPLVYKQQNREPSNPIYDLPEQSDSNQFESFPSGSFSDPEFFQGPQNAGPYPNSDVLLPTNYQQLPFSASYHAYPPSASASHFYPDTSAAAIHPGWHTTLGMSDTSGTVLPPSSIGDIPQVPRSDLFFAQQSQHRAEWGPLGPWSVSTHGPSPFSSFAGNFEPLYEHQNAVAPAPGPEPYFQHDDLQDGGSRRRHTSGSWAGSLSHTTRVAPMPGAAALPNTNIPMSSSSDNYEDPADPFDVDSDDEDLSYQAAAENFTQMLDQSAQNKRRMSRPNAVHTPHQTLTNYRPTTTISPLREERNQHIFHHFVEVTSQCISVFERHHFSSIAGPARTLWNFTIPSMAMSHPALAHAILALGAVHLSKLQNTSDAVAVKHFTYAVRRVGKLLGLPTRRLEIATLATVLVLGYYEVMSGDHSRWNLHLSGATKLVLEHDYAGMTRTARRMRNGAKARVNQWMAHFALTKENYARVAGIPLALLDDIDWEVDSAFISRLSGINVDYDHQVQPQFPTQNLAADLSEKEIEDLKAKMDLRWWCCKQDIFQSLLGGDRLLIPYEDWKYCPPRGQLGRSANPYATLDHLSLILARLADFGGKDRARKQRTLAATRGEWKPPMWLFGPQGPPGGTKEPSKGRKPSDPPENSRAGRAGRAQRPMGHHDAKASAAPSANESRVRQSRPNLQGSGTSSRPPMMGMIPPPSEPIVLHSAFKTMDANLKDPAFTGMKGEKKSTPPLSLDDETTRALTEHAEITKAFDLFARSLGPDFDPLPYTDTPVTTPFGPALNYKNAGIACIWAFYYVGRILLHRFHPEMPPAAMVAAGVTAHLTRDHAQAVGRICAGLYATPQYSRSGSLDPSFAGALMESTFPLLFAAVQYTDPAQRGWTISKLRDVSLRCGWQSSGAIAAACETAWERMGQAGKGPPYEKRLDPSNHDARVTGAGRRPSMVTTRSGDAMAEHESAFVIHDRSLIDRSSSTRVHWALGLLSVEEDIKHMSLNG
nr:hypothetical protein LTR18_010199 [Exophiala xenobiotica]